MYFIIFGPNPRTQVSKPLQVQMTTPSTTQLACKTMPLGPSHSPTLCTPTYIKQPTRPFPSFSACMTAEPPHAEPSLHLYVNHAKPTCFSLPTCSCPFHPQAPYLLTLLHQAVPYPIPLAILSLPPHLPLHPLTPSCPLSYPSNYPVPSTPLAITPSYTKPSPLPSP